MSTDPEHDKHAEADQDTADVVGAEAPDDAPDDGNEGDPAAEQREADASPHDRQQRRSPRDRQARSTRTR